MANQRKKTKVHIGGYFEKSLKVQLKQTADDRGISFSALINELLENAVNQTDALHESATSADPEAAAGRTAKTIARYPALRRNS